MNLLPASHIVQKPGYCFPACLSSFLKDAGCDISQEDIVEKCPSLFGKGSDVEGGFAAKNFPLLAKHFGFSCAGITGDFSVSHPSEAVLFFCHWELQSWHWVRFVGQDDKKMYLMNPASNKFPYDIEIQEFHSWVKATYKLKK